MPSGVKYVDRVVIVQHFHWDLCWWHSEEESARNLVLAMEKIVEALEKGYAKTFLLDGQLYPLHELRKRDPDLFRRAIELAKRGALEVGPFYTQIDLYRVSGESIVRNLLIARRLCKELDIPCLGIAYIPDTFGIPLILPEILRGFGIDVLVTSRGMSMKDLERLGTVFLWRAPSGSTVLTIYVPTGYLNAGMLGVSWSTICRLRRYLALPLRLWSYTSEIYHREPALDVEEAVKRLREIVEVSKKLSRCGIHIAMNGVDRKSIQLDVLRKLDEISRRLGIPTDVVDLRTLVKIVRENCREIPAYDREMFGSSYMAILSASSSSRVELKKMLFVLERMLSLYLEPLLVISDIIGRTPRSIRRDELDSMWIELLKLLSHDVVCGTVADEPYTISLGRAVSLIKDVGSAIAHILTSIGVDLGPRPGVLIFNPHPWRVKAPVEFVVYPFSRPYVEGGYVGSSRIELLEPDTAFPRFIAVLELEPLSLVYLPITRREAVSTPIEEVRSGTIAIGFDRLRTVFDIDRRSIAIHLGNHMVLARLVADEERGDLYNHEDGVERIDLLRRGDVKCYVYRGRDLAWIAIEFSSDIASGTLRIAMYRGVPRIDLCIEIFLEKPGYRVSLEIFTDTVGRVVAYTPMLAVERDSERVCEGEECFEEFPFQEWIAVVGDASGIVVGARGLYEYRVRSYARGALLSLTLIRSVEWLARDLVSRKTLAGPRIRTPLALELGYHRFELCIALVLDNLSNTLRYVKTFVVPPIATIIDGPEERREEFKLSILSISSNQFVELYTLKPCEEGDRCFVARFGAPISDTHLRISFFRELDLYITNLAEEIEQSLGTRSTIDLHLKRGSLVTIKARY